MTRTLEQIHQVVKAYAIIFVFWGLYRIVFRLPEELEETFLKPLVFIGAAVFVEKPKNIGLYFLDIWGKGNWIRALIAGLMFGLGYLFFYATASFLAFAKLELGSELNSQFWISLLGIGTLTAIWEEWTFSGYILRKLSAISASAWPARITTALLFALIHLPILVFWYKFTGSVVLFQLTLLFILGIGNTILMGFSKNLLAPVVSHIMWGMAIYLFK